MASAPPSWDERHPRLCHCPYGYQGSWGLQLTICVHGVGGLSQRMSQRLSPFCQDQELPGFPDLLKGKFPGVPLWGGLQVCYEAFLARCWSTSGRSQEARWVQLQPSVLRVGLANALDDFQEPKGKVSHGSWGKIDVLGYWKSCTRGTSLPPAVLREVHGLPTRRITGSRTRNPVLLLIPTQAQVLPACSLTDWGSTGLSPLLFPTCGLRLSAQPLRLPLLPKVQCGLGSCRKSESTDHQLLKNK